MLRNLNKASASASIASTFAASLPLSVAAESPLPQAEGLALVAACVRVPSHDDAFILYSFKIAMLPHVSRCHCCVSAADIQRVCVHAARAAPRWFVVLAEDSVGNTSGICRIMRGGCSCCGYCFCFSQLRPQESSDAIATMAAM